MICIVQSFGNKKIINLGNIDNQYKMVICDNETHNNVKLLLSLKKQLYLPHTSVPSKNILGPRARRRTFLH